jgi:DNA-binding MarR family transcriptional regulator
LPKAPGPPPGTTVSFGRLVGVLGYNLRRAQLRAFETFEQVLGPGVHPGQLAVLCLIEANPGIKQTTLAAALSVDRSTMVRLIDHCEAADLVRRSPSKVDRRAAPPLLTPIGRRYMEHIWPKIEENEARLAEPLTAAEVRTLLRLLQKLTGLHTQAPPSVSA